VYKLTNPIKKFIEIVKMLITFPIAFIRYRKGLQNVQSEMRDMLKDPKFRKEYIEYQKFIHGNKPTTGEYIDAEYKIFDDDEDIDEFSDNDEDIDDIDDIFI